MKTLENTLFIPQDQPSSFYLLCYLIFTFPLIASCSQDRELFDEINEQELPSEPIVGYDNVDEALWDYFDRFELEAAARGITIDIRSENITGNIREISSEHVAGTCNYSYRNPNKVTIDLEFWSRSGDRYKEFVVFHELGHCVLYREHKEEASAFNICESIMRSGTGSCIDNYTRSTRSSYLDELFDPTYKGNLFLTSID